MTDTNDSGLSGAFVVKTDEAVKLHLPLCPLVSVIQKLMGPKVT